MNKQEIVNQIGKQLRCRGNPAGGFERSSKKFDIYVFKRPRNKKWRGRTVYVALPDGFVDKHAYSNIYDPCFQGKILLKPYFGQINLYQGTSNEIRDVYYSRCEVSKPSAQQNIKPAKKKMFFMLDINNGKEEKWEK